MSVDLRRRDQHHPRRIGCDSPARIASSVDRRAERIHLEGVSRRGPRLSDVRQSGEVIDDFGRVRGEELSQAPSYRRCQHRSGNAKRPRRPSPRGGWRANARRIPRHRSETLAPPQITGGSQRHENTPRSKWRCRSIGGAVRPVCQRVSSSSSSRKRPLVWRQRGPLGRSGRSNGERHCLRRTRTLRRVQRS